MMLEMKTTEFLEVLSSREPVPGGGGASAAVGSMGAALGMMVANLTVGKKKYADVEDEIKEVLDKLEELKDKLVCLTDRDAQVFEPLSRAYGLPGGTPRQKAEKEAVLQKALYEASVVPVEIMETVLEVMKLLKILGEKGSRIAQSDVGAGVLFAQAALEGASLNVFINTRLMKDERKAHDLNDRADVLIEEGRAYKKDIYENVLLKLR